MKKIILILALFLTTLIGSAQVQTINSQLKLTNVPAAGVNDTLILVQGADKIVKKVNKSSLVPTPTIPNLQQVTTAGAVTDNTIKVVSAAGDSLAVVSSGYISVGDLGSDYDGNWERFFTVFDPNNSEKVIDMYSKDSSLDKSVQLTLNPNTSQFINTSNSGGSSYYQTLQLDTGSQSVFLHSDKNTPPDLLSHGLYIKPDEFSIVKNTLINKRIFSVGNMGGLGLDYSVQMGDLDGNGNDTKLSVNDVESKINLLAHDKLEFKSSGIFPMNFDSTISIQPNNIDLSSNIFTITTPQTGFTSSFISVDLSDNRSYNFPDANGTFALESYVDSALSGVNLQSVLNAGGSASFDSDNLSVRLPTLAERSFNISDNVVSGDDSTYYTMFAGSGSVITQVGDYNDTLTSYGDRTISVNSDKIYLRNIEYSLPADELQNSGIVEANKTNVTLIAQDVPTTSTSTVTVYANQLHYNVTTEGEEATFYFSHADGVAFATNTATGEAGRIKSDNITAERTLQIPDESGTIALQKYKVYSVLVSQSGTSDPTVTVLENTLGITPIPYRAFTAGSYGFGATGTYPIDKTYVIVGDSQTYTEEIRAVRTSDNDVFIRTWSAGVPTDGILNNTTFEIRVYN